jgi:hypothetical protein
MHALTTGSPAFELFLGNRLYASAQLYAFDLLKLAGEDLRGQPIGRAKMHFKTYCKKTALGF